MADGGDLPTLLVEPPAHLLLSIIIPVYNEAPSIEFVLERVRATRLADDIIVVDDGLTDGTYHRLSSMGYMPGLKLVRHSGKRGKGAAIRLGLELASGAFVIVQDADSEYDPADYPALLKPLIMGASNVVYGWRRNDSLRRGPLLFLGARFLTFVANVLYGCQIHDEATGYKAFRLNLLKRVELKCERFDFCHEVTAKICRLGERIAEVPISYRPRTVAGGKKLRWTDGMSALLTLIRYRFQPRHRFDREHALDANVIPAMIGD